MNSTESTPNLDKEYGNNSGKLPGFLLTLLILTSINITYNLYRALKELFVSAESTASIEATVYQSLDDSGVELNEMPDWLTSGLFEFLEKYAQNAVNIRIADIAYYILLAASVVMMAQLRLMGYYLYVAVNVLGIVIVPFLYGMNFISVSAMIMYAILAVIFIALYSANRKHLH